MGTKETAAMGFGNWVPVKMIAVPGVLGLTCLGLGILFWPLFIAGGLFAAISLYFLSARIVFSPRGGNLQEQVHALLLSHVEAEMRGKALDIGCGNGALTIRLAQRCPGMRVEGMDSWGEGWDYSRNACEANARAAGVEQRVGFTKGSASALPFEDASFDLVVSNFVFHEVKDVADKRQCIRESLRVLKPGGSFVLQDLFLLKKFYGSPDGLLTGVESLGASSVEFIRTHDAPFIPRLVKLPFMLGRMAILRGVK